MKGIMNKLRLLVRTVLHGHSASPVSDAELADAKRRADFAVDDLTKTMERLTSVPKGGNR